MQYGGVDKSMKSVKSTYPGVGGTYIVVEEFLNHYDVGLGVKDIRLRIFDRIADLVAQRRDPVFDCTDQSIKMHQSPHCRHCVQVDF